MEDAEQLVVCPPVATLACEARVGGVEWSGVVWRSEGEGEGTTRTRNEDKGAGKPLILSIG